MSALLRAVGDRLAPNAPIPATDVLLILGVAASGSAAAAMTASALWFVTVAVIVVLLVASHRGAAALGSKGEARLHTLPAPLRGAIAAALSELPEGDAKRCLEHLTERAALLFAPRQSTFDEDWERGTLQQVADLVVAACGVARDIARLDRAVPSEALPDDHVAAGLIATRRLFVGRLDDASAALAALYSAGVENGTPASDRVGELVNEIRADAALTSHARRELERLLRSTR